MSSCCEIGAPPRDGKFSNLCATNLFAQTICATVIDSGTVRANRLETDSLTMNELIATNIAAENIITDTLMASEITTGDLTITGTLNACGGSNTGTLFTGNGANSMICFDPLVDNPMPAAVGDVLTYTGAGPFGVEWLGLSTTDVCTDNFAVTVGRGPAFATGCQVPAASPAGQILAYDGFVGQQPLGPAPSTGVQWAATNGTAAARSQVLYFDSTLGTSGLPTYNVATSSTPSALIVPAAGAPIPTWLVPAAVGDCLCFDGTDLVFSSPVCNGANEVTIGTGIPATPTTCLAPTNDGDCLCFDGSSLVFNLMNVTWRVDNLTVAAGTTDLNTAPGSPEGLLWDAAAAVDQFPGGDITIALNPGPGMFLPVNAAAPAYTEITITRTGTYAFIGNITYDRGMGSNDTVAVLEFVQSALPAVPIRFGPGILTNAMPSAAGSGTTELIQIVTITATPALFAVQTEGTGGGGATLNYPSILAAPVPRSSWRIIRLR